ncbi:hypothetical protein TrVFT333_000004 [Trichoderma virens FT-333]|nr:hypothetical protein TrVFT333_000004 [Trichoderma virens FT-333]
MRLPLYIIPFLPLLAQATACTNSTDSASCDSGTTMALLDVLIIGGGPGGLAAATGLARQLYTAVVFDSGVYRNAPTKHMHNVPTWDHRDPADFRAKARSDVLARYDTIKFEKTTIESVRRRDDGRFEAKDINGTVWAGKKIVLASGMRDIFPDIPGYAEAWGRGVYHCLFCDGYEDRGASSAGVLAIGDVANVSPALNLARMAKRLAEKVVIYTNGATELMDQIVAALGSDPVITFDNRRVVRLEKVDEDRSETIVYFDDGSSVSQGFLVHKPKTEVNGPFAKQLSLEMTETGAIKTNLPFYETSVNGVFAVGDCASSMPAVVNALAMGAFAAGGLAAQLGAEPTGQSK